LQTLSKAFGVFMQSCPKFLYQIDEFGRVSAAKSLGAKVADSIFQSAVHKGLRVPLFYV